MDTLTQKILVIILIFLGESIAIYAEMMSAKSNLQNSFWPIFFKAFLIITIAGALLVGGYMLGLEAFQNIWIVSVTSITSILIMEPIIAILIVQQTPTIGALIGFILGALGLIATLFF